jgi:hypothetical protein
MIDKPSIVEFVTDPQLLGLTLSPAQETLLRAIYGLALEGDAATNRGVRGRAGGLWGSRRQERAGSLPVDVLRSDVRRP